MKIFSTIFFALLFPFAIQAQNLIISPSKTVNVEYKLNEFEATKVSLLNNSGGTMLLTWNLIYNNLPIEWDYSLCDYGGCHPGVPNEREMAPIADGVEGYLIMNIMYLEDASEGSVAFALSNNYDTTIDTITFNFKPGTVGINQQKNNLELAMFPNPASNTLRINNPFNNIATLSVMNMSGKEILNTQLNAGIQSADISALPNGLYIVSLKNRDAVLTQKLSIVK
jgi:hypothetical protein